MINPDLAEHKAICYSSYWRALPEGTDHPRHFVRLNEREVRELIATGGFSLPDHVVPESVRAWRKTQETVVDLISEAAEELANV